MTDGLLFIVGGAGLFFLAAVVIVVVALLASPEWFSRAFASMLGGFAGVSVAMVAVVVSMCMCGVLGCGVILLVVSQSVPVG